MLNQQSACITDNGMGSLEILVSKKWDVTEIFINLNGNQNMIFISSLPIFLRKKKSKKESSSSSSESSDSD